MKCLLRIKLQATPRQILEKSKRRELEKIFTAKDTVCVCPPKEGAGVLSAHFARIWESFALSALVRRICLLLDPPCRFRLNENITINTAEAAAAGRQFKISIAGCPSQFTCSGAPLATEA
jgi:hypothetical protein